MELTHTPVPWHTAANEVGYFVCVEHDNRLIARCDSSDRLQAERDAGFIVLACNAYERLLADLATLASVRKLIVEAEGK